MTANASSPPSFSLKLFGPPQICIGGLPLLRLPSRKAMALLALLALRPERTIDREWLAGALWPEAPQPSANLRSALSELRQALGDEARRLQSPTRFTLLLDLTDGEVDVLQFDRAIASKRIPALEQAVALYQGAFLEDSREEWAALEREVRKQDCLRALETLAANAFATDDSDMAADYWRRALSVEPYSDVARRGVMKALARSGDVNRALQVYREFVELLKSDPIAAPDTETTALYRRLRRQIRTGEGNRPDVGERTVKELSAPVIQGNLPYPLTGLIGREDERLEIAVCLQRSRLVTLTGTGGIGKTRLALEVAADVVRGFADGVCHVGLETLADPARLCRQIALVLGLKEEAHQCDLTVVTAHLRAKRLLLLLDNCEHLLEECARIAAHLLKECAEVRILTTSREALGIVGESIWRVPALPVPDCSQLPPGQVPSLRALLGYEGVQLFVERAQAVQKTFALTRENARTVARVCARLEGIPLAIELAAARVQAMTLEQIAERENNYLGLLAGGSRTALSRQQTLRATLDWSYRLLSKEERSFWRRLAVFAGGWNLEAAEQVGSGEGIEADQVWNLLAGLVNKSLVVFEEREDRGGGRYRLLETVRQYAMERLKAAGETELSQRRHGDWMAAFVEKADEQLNGVEQERWLKRLATEHDNLRAALSWSHRAEEGSETELRLVGALWRFWDMHGHHCEGREYLLRALERPETPEPSTARARAFTGAAALSLRQGALVEARELHQKSLNMHRRLGNRRGTAVSLGNQAVVVWIQGDYATARTLWEESLDIHRELDNRLGISGTLHGLGQLMQWQGDLQTARAYFEESHRINRELGDLHGAAFTLESLGQIALLSGEYPEARMQFEECLAMRRDLDDRHGIALSIGNLGICSRYQGDLMTASALFEEGEVLFQELGDSRGVGFTLCHKGIIADGHGDRMGAKKLLEEGLTLLRRSGDRAGVNFALNNLGKVVTEQGDYAAARTFLEESLTICAALGGKQGVAESLERFATLSWRQENARKAVCLWGVAHALRKTIGTPLPLYERAEYDRQLAQVCAMLGISEFDLAWEEGSALSWEQAVSYVLETAER